MARLREGLDALRRIGPVWRRTPRRFFLLSQYRRLGRERISFRRRGFRWTGFGWDEDVTWGLYAHGDFQGEERVAVAAWMRHHGHLSPSRDLVVDVGANIGTTSLPLARDQGCRVLAIEPDPENFAVLEMNVRRNGLQGRVRCRRAAVSPQRGAVELLAPALASGGVELAPAEPPSPRLPAWRNGVRGRVSTAAAPLSEILSDEGVTPDSVAFVWSDAQGSDGHVLATGRELWAAGVPLFMELWPDGLRRHGTDGVVRAADRYGFDSFLEAGELPSGGPPRPIGELTAVMEEQRDVSDQIDVLLIPGAARAA